jgi:hypothetical protein
MNDNDNKYNDDKPIHVWLGVRKPDGSYENAIPIPAKSTITLELSPQFKLAFYRVIFPGLVEWFGDSVN